MGARLVSVDRHTPMLLPPGLRECVPEKDPIEKETKNECAQIEKI